MFAENQKISPRQVRRLFLLDVFGLSSLLLPGIFSSLSGADGIFSLLFGMAASGVMLLLMHGNIKRMEGGYYAYMRECVGTLAGNLFQIFYLVYFLSLSGFVLYQTTVLVLSWLLPEGSYLGVSLLLVLLAGYGAMRGIEGRARVYEIIFWFLGIPLLAMLGLALREVDADRWAPLAASSLARIGEGGLAFSIFLLPLSGILFLKPFCSKPEKLTSCAAAAWLGAAGLNLAVYLILLGVFGTKALGALERPALTLMGMINFPGGFFNRQDVVMVSVWFFALFALLNTGVFQSGLIWKELCRSQKDRHSLPLILAFVFFLGAELFENPFLLEAYDVYQKWAALPGMAGILALLLSCGRIKAWRRARKEGRA